MLLRKKQSPSVVIIFHLMPARYLLLLIFTVTTWSAENPVRIDEKIGQYLPGDLVFLNESGDSVTPFIEREIPVLLSLVYFDCPSICTPFLNGLAGLLQELDREPGKDFEMITISFDPTESSESAQAKKHSVLAGTGGIISPSQWKFLTGDSANVTRLLEATGFHYLKINEDLAHTTVLIALSPKGKITRYLHGIQFLPFDVKLALVEADEGKTGMSINKIVQFCYSYNPEGKRYVLNTTRIVGAAMIAAMLIFVAVLVFIRKKSRK